MKEEYNKSDIVSKRKFIRVTELLRRIFGKF